MSLALKLFYINKFICLLCEQFSFLYPELQTQKVVPLSRSRQCPFTQGLDVRQAGEEVGWTVVDSGTGFVGQRGHSVGEGWVGQLHGSGVGQAEVVSVGWTVVDSGTGSVGQTVGEGWVGQLHGSWVGQAEVVSVGWTVVDSGTGSVGHDGHAGQVAWVGQLHGSDVGHSVGT